MAGTYLTTQERPREPKRLELAELQLALAALAALPHDEATAIELVARLATAHGIRGLGDA